MSLKLYLSGMALGTILCFASSALIVVYINPEENHIFGPAGVFTSLFLGLTGFFTLVGFYVRVLVSKNEVLFHHISPAFREAFLISFYFIGLFVLQAFRTLSWWNAIFFMIAVILFEFYFLSR